MGIFSTLRKNMNNGGVKVNLTSPGSAKFDDSSLPVTVVITAKSAQKINKVTVALNAYYYINKNQPGQGAPQVMQTITLSDEFKIEANENITLSGNLPVVTMIDQQNVAGSGIVNKLNKLGNNLDYNYFITAYVDVDGIKLDPKASNQIVFNNALVHGKAFNF